MLKPVITATAVLAIAGSSIVYAQQFSDARHDDAGPRFEHRHRHLSAEDRAAFTDARIAALKAGLELTADQTKNWPAFEQALRDLAQLRAQRIQAREAAADQPPPSSPFDRLSRRADNMAKTSAALKHLADAGAPLYMSLTDTQKERFKMLSRILRPHHRMHAGRGGGGWREGMGREGMGRDGDGSRGERHFGRDGGWRGQPQFDRERGGWREGQGFGYDGPRHGQDRARVQELMGSESGDEQL
jgi:zinc resistance-associated protein